uniref:7TM_GPCR_Srx domain-containing protein n=1 Tax=Angiostrongylus cantonensis TaxID=6313 RepID=A0A0K0DA07_ANGCA
MWLLRCRRIRQRLKEDQTDRQMDLLENARVLKFLCICTALIIDAFNNMYGTFFIEPLKCQVSPSSSVFFLCVPLVGKGSIYLVHSPLVNSITF